MKYVKAFKALLKSSNDPKALLAEVPYRCAIDILRALPEGLIAPGEREHWFVMTDTGVDREGDVIFSSGVDVSQFSQKGSVLWGHRADHPDFVLGKPAEVVKEETRILVRAAFANEEENPLGARVSRMISSGIVRGMSVGIMVHEYTEANDRAGWYPLNILRSELVETSVTPVPINPRAVALEIGESGSSEGKALLDGFEATADANEPVAGLSAAQVKALVQETVNEILGVRAYSLPALDPALVAIGKLARLAQ